MTVVWIVIASVAFVLVLLVGIGIAARLTFAAIAGPLNERIAASVPASDVMRKDLRANNIGIESKGVTQLRGNGALVLTPTALRFFQLVPKSEHVVPLASIREVSFVRAHLGKSVGYRLLKVAYDTDAGPDSVAWYVVDPDAWKAAIEQARAA